MLIEYHAGGSTPATNRPRPGDDLRLAFNGPTYWAAEALSLLAGAARSAAAGSQKRHGSAPLATWTGGRSSPRCGGMAGGLDPAPKLSQSTRVHRFIVLPSSRGRYRLRIQVIAAVLLKPDESIVLSKQLACSRLRGRCVVRGRSRNRNCSQWRTSQRLLTCGENCNKAAAPSHEGDASSHMNPAVIQTWSRFRSDHHGGVTVRVFFDHNATEPRDLSTRRRPRTGRGACAFRLLCDVCATGSTSRRGAMPAGRCASRRDLRQSFPGPGDGIQFRQSGIVQLFRLNSDDVGVGMAPLASGQLPDVCHADGNVCQRGNDHTDIVVAGECGRLRSGRIGSGHLDPHRRHSDDADVGNHQRIYQ
jgi:hypothetical protein